MNQSIAGVLILNTTKLLGSNKRGVPIYLFRALANDITDYWVCSKTRSKDNILVIISTVTNKTCNSKWKYPRGEIIKIIGKVSDPYAYRIALLYKNGLYIKNDKRKIICDEDELVEPQKDFIFSVDPPGCTDIDDAISINDNTITVYIADVTKFFFTNCEYDAELQKKITSVYLSNGEVFHMLPISYATNICSLRQNKIRSTIKITLTYQDGELVKYDIPETQIIINNRAMSYNKASQILKGEPNDSRIYQSLYSISKLLNITNTHKIIEKLMVDANVSIGDFITKNGYPFTRGHEITEMISVNMKAGIDLDLDLLKEHLKLKSYKAANYVFANSKHYGLKKVNYTHFTSPIRRYADIIVHRIIKAIIGTSSIKCDLNEMANMINSYTKKVKKFYFNQYLIDLYETILENGGCQIMKAYLIGYNLERNYGVFYIPERNLEFKGKIISNKIKDLIEISINNLEISFHRKDTSIKTTKTIKFYQKLDLELTAFHNVIPLSKKVKMKIIGFELT